MLSYLWWLLLFCALPLTALWILYFDILRRSVRILVLAIIGALLVSVPWDVISIQERIWFFETPHILGVWLLGLPIEEWLFIIIVTALFASITLVLDAKLAKHHVR